MRCIAKTIIKRCMPSLVKANVNRPKIKALMLFDEIIFVKILEIFYDGTLKGMEKMDDVKTDVGKILGLVVERHHSACFMAFKASLSHREFLPQENEAGPHASRDVTAAASLIGANRRHFKILVK